MEGEWIAAYIKYDTTLIDICFKLDKIWAQVQEMKGLGFMDMLRFLPGWQAELNDEMDNNILERNKTTNRRYCSVPLHLSYIRRIEGLDEVLKASELATH